MNIMLIGFKSCGKTTTGRALAQELAMTFVDTDAHLEQRHARLTSENLSFREIFRHYGRDYFLDLEAQVLASLAEADHQVIATGGGTVINQPLPPELCRQATVIYLEVLPEILWSRIQAGGRPAFFKTANPQQEFYELFRQRAPIYQQLADYTVEVSDGDVDRILIAIKQRLTF